MRRPIAGIHHVTALASDPQARIEQALPPIEVHEPVKAGGVA